MNGAKSPLVGGRCHGGPLNGKRMAWGGPAMPAFDDQGRRIGTYVWDAEAGVFEFDAEDNSVDNPEDENG